MISYINRANNKEIVLDDKNLIKPQELYKHIGERLIFHNGFGYVVSGILEEANEEFNPYQYNIDTGIDYSHELSISYFYCDKNNPDSIVELEEMYCYLYTLQVQGITHDELMHNYAYIAIPTKEEQEFIDNLLSMSKEEIIEKYEKAKADLEIWENDYSSKRFINNNI